MEFHIKEQVTNLDDSSDFESDNVSSNAEESDSEYDKELSKVADYDEDTRAFLASYKPSKETMVRDHVLSLTGLVVRQFAQQMGHFNAKSVSSEVKSIIKLIDNRVLPCLQVANANEGYGEVYLVYLEIGTVNYMAPFDMLESIKKTNINLSNSLVKAINDITNAACEANKHISTSPLFAEEETLTMYYHYNDQHRITINVKIRSR